jgi:integrase
MRTRISKMNHYLGERSGAARCSSMTRAGGCRKRRLSALCGDSHVARGLKSAGQLSPHSLRHTFATSLDDAGVLLQDIQDAMGPRGPRTTHRYMATHQHLDRHATYAFAAWLPRTGSETASD